VFDHREIEAAIEAIVPGTGYRRIYPICRGWPVGGLRPDPQRRCGAAAWRFIDRLGAGPVMLLGHSYGAYLARGVAAQVGWKVDVGSSAFTAPTLIVAGRRDSVVGVADAAELLERYPHATLAVIEDAGHALMHERPELLAALLGDWLDRARAGQATSA